MIECKFATNLLKLIIEKAFIRSYNIFILTEVTDNETSI